MHQQQWGPTQGAVAADGGSAMLPVTDTSSYVNDLANAIAVFRCVFCRRLRGLLLHAEESCRGVWRM